MISIYIYIYIYIYNSLRFRVLGEGRHCRIGPKSITDEVHVYVCVYIYIYIYISKISQQHQFKRPPWLQPPRLRPPLRGTEC